MFSRTFEFKGYDDQMHKETWWFNLSEAELYELELGTVGGVNGMMNRMLREEQPDKIVEMFKKIILKAVGERSADGRRFVKRERPGMPWGEVAEDFRETPAYAQLFTELVKSGEALANFLKAAIPADVAAKLAQMEAQQKKEEAEKAVKSAEEAEKKAMEEGAKIVPISEGVTGVENH